jgi:hypothetical protein
LGTTAREHGVLYNVANRHTGQIIGTSTRCGGTTMMLRLASMGSLLFGLALVAEAGQFNK